MRKILILLALVSLVPTLVSAETIGAETKVLPKINPCVGKIVPINSIPGNAVLYKPENIHGGRGPSFLVQNVSQRTNKQTLEIRNARCEVIAAIGLFRTDQPYGSRYYMATGGTGQSDAELLELAKKVGSNNILIEGVNGTWIRIKNPLEREGSVIK